MSVKSVHVVFPSDLVDEPVIFTVAKTSGVIPSITYSKIEKTSAEFVLRLEGTTQQIEHALRLLAEKGTVTPVKPTKSKTRKRSIL